jgi:hypothetical protein
LQWVLFDAAGDSIFQWPGPIDPTAFLDASLQAEAITQTALPPIAPLAVNSKQLYIDPLCQSIYEYFVDPIHLLQEFRPHAGFELSESGLVVAQAELAWLKYKSAIVLTVEDYANFIDRGWRVWLASIDEDNQSSHEDILELPTLLAHLRRAEQIISSAN